VIRNKPYVSGWPDYQDEPSTTAQEAIATCSISTSDIRSFEEECTSDSVLSVRTMAQAEHDQAGQLPIVRGMLERNTKALDTSSSGAPHEADQQ
jgi:hypothetical protein